VYLTIAVTRTLTRCSGRRQPTTEPSWQTPVEAYIAINWRSAGPTFFQTKQSNLCTSPDGSRQSAHEGGKVVSPQEVFVVLISDRGWVDPRTIGLMKNSDNTNGDRIPDLPACSAVHRPTAPPRAAMTGTVHNSVRADDSVGAIQSLFLRTPTPP
jgi:hypothetical protein